MKKFPLEPIEKASRKKLQALQLERLRWSLKHAYECVPHFRKKFDKAGVKPGDVLTEVEGKPVADPTSMLNLIAALAPGKPASVKLKRNGNDVDATITVGRRPKPQARPAE